MSPESAEPRPRGPHNAAMATSASAAAAGIAAPPTTTTTSHHHYRPQQLSAATNDLAALLARGQATLDTLTARLEAEFSERFGGGAGGGKNNTIDPCALAARARRLERELPALRREAEEAARARRALAGRAAEVLGGTRTRLHELSVRSGLAPPRDQREGHAMAAAVWASAAHAAALAEQQQPQQSGGGGGAATVVGRQ